MYAIVAEDGRQYKLTVGQELDLDFREVSAGSKVTLSNVLAIGDGSGVKLGTPTLAGASVTVEVLGLRQGPKILTRKFRRRKNYRRKIGHRQLYTRVRVSEIQS